LKVLAAAKKVQPEAEIVVITGHGSIDTAVAAIKAGAFDYLIKPIDPDELSIVLHKALERKSLLGEGKFREDLYYRLKVFPIFLPPLHERPEDILPLVEHFLREAGKKSGGKTARISPQAAEALKAYSWPGNVRELEHAVERILIMAKGGTIEEPDIPPEMRAGAKNKA